MSPDASHDIGHNSMAEIDIIRDSLEREYDPLKVRRDELIAACSRIPAVIEDDAVAGNVADQIKQISAAIKKADAARVEKKEPYLAGGRCVDGFFKGICDPLDKTKRQVAEKLTIWERKKAAEERRRRDEAERIARKEAEAARKAAAEAEAKLQEAEDLDAAIEAEERRKQAEADLAKAEKSADVKAAALHTTRGDYGASSSLRTYWDFKGLDRDTVDLEALRHHFPQDAIEKAMRSFIKAGNREIKGATIFQNTTSAVR